MNPTEQSGDDLCEQPGLSWVDYRNLAGLSVIAVIIFLLGTSVLKSDPEATPAAAQEAIISEETLIESEKQFEFVTVVDTEPPELPMPTVESIN